MADRSDPTDELIAYLELRLEADGLDYREAVMIEDLKASLAHLKNSGTENPVNRGPTDAEALRDSAWRRSGGL